MKPTYLAILIVMNVFWSATVSIYKVMESHLSTGGIVTMRFGSAALILAVSWFWLPGKAPRGWDLVRTILMGLVVFMLGHRLQVYGNKLNAAADSSVLLGVEPLVTSVAAAIFLREHIGPRRWVGFALGLVGVGLLNRIWEPGFQWIGLAASAIFISSFLCESVYSILGKPLIERAGGAKILALALLAGTVANLAIDGRETIASVRTMPPHYWWMIIYMGSICTAFGYAIWFVIIRNTDVNLAALTIFVQPVSGVLIAAVWLGERLHWGHLWGSLAILAGLGLGLSRQVKRA